MKSRPILIIFGIQRPEGTWHWKVIDLPSSSINCCCTTLRSAKSYFLNQDSSVMSNS